MNVIAMSAIVGTNLYGFNKRLARVASRGSDFDISGDFGEIPGAFHLDRSAWNHRPLFRDRRRPQFPRNAADLSALDRRVGLFVSRLSTRDRYFPAHGDEGDRVRSPRVPPFSRRIEPGEEKCFPYIPWFRMSTNWRLSVPLTAGQISDTTAQNQLRNVAAHLRRARTDALLNRTSGRGKARR